MSAPEKRYPELVRKLSLEELQWFDSLTVAYKALKAMSNSSYTDGVVPDMVSYVTCDLMCDHLFDAANHAGHLASNPVLLAFAVWVSEGGYQK